MTNSIINNSEQLIKLLENGDHLTVVTHDGPWHADEVFCIAKIRKLAEQALPCEILRLSPRSSIPEIEERVKDKGPVVILDMAGGWLDHHGPRQALCKYPDGAPKATISLLEDALEATLRVSESESELYRQISLMDCTGKISGIIPHAFLAMTMGGKFATFEKAVAWAGNIIDTLRADNELMPAQEVQAMIWWAANRMSGQFKKRFLAYSEADKVKRTLPEELYHELLNVIVDYEIQQAMNFAALIENLQSLPTVEIKGHKFIHGKGDKFQPLDLKLDYSSVLPGIAGFIDVDFNIKGEPTGGFCFRLFNNVGVNITNCGLSACGDVIFTHATGFTGKTKTFEALSECFK